MLTLGIVEESLLIFYKTKYIIFEILECMNVYV